MKITEAYVAVAVTGLYLHTSESQSHVGVRTSIEWVENIDDATVFRSPCFLVRGLRDKMENFVVNWVPVEVRHEIILKGYGVRYG